MIANHSNYNVTTYIRKKKEKNKRNKEKAK